MSIECCGCQAILDEEEFVKLARPSGVSICDRCAKKVWESYECWHAGRTFNQVKVKPVRRRVTDAVRLKIFKRDGFQCKRCNTHDDLTIDHIHPVSKGGSSEDNNLQTLCMACNREKGASV
ncbi:HNH endonuclease [Serratia liquefaciens]|uniref:HNH endonuclease n=1 Tax=Serratia liquefaciens TaxID=614 RepID=UPI0009005F2A|nr:HNH endonuclease [Serratia liquefaciens]AUW40053.1 HNH endonuclease [Serratia liquefaciens]